MICGPATSCSPRLVRQSRFHLFNIGFGGQIVISAARSWLSGDRDWAQAQRRFGDACGEEPGKEALACLAGVLETLARAARRPVLLNQPRHFGVSHDEWLILQMVAAAQDDDEPALSAILSLLLRRHEADSAREILATAAGHLRRGGVRIERHRVERPPRRKARGPELLLACG